MSRPHSIRLWLFGLYLALYLGFMLLTTFGLDVMATPVLDGVNLAIVYGLLLIVTAFVFALIYMWRKRDAGAAGASR